MVKTSLLAKLKSSPKIALDSGIYISFLKGNKDPFFQESELIFEHIKAGKETFASDLVFLESSVHFFRQSQGKEKIYDHLHFLTANGLIIYVALDRQIALAAAQLRAQYPSLKTPDAIHLATALQVKSPLFITTDQLKIKQIGGLEIYVLGT